MKTRERKAAIAEAVSLLRENGYLVEYAPGLNEWTSPGELAERLKLHPNTITLRLNHAACPVFERSPAEGRRIRRLRMNAALFRFLRQPSRRLGGYVKHLLPLEDLD